MRCCVIGTGYAGLGALRHLGEFLDFSSGDELVAFERQDNVGGLWNYDPRVGEDEFGLPVHGAIYQNTSHFFHSHLPPDLDSSSFHDPRMVFHSKQYRSPDKFMGKRVAVLGAGPSGMDIAVDIANSHQSTKVYLCHEKNRCGVDFPSNVIQKSKIIEIKEKSIIVREGKEELSVDGIILCTGYRYKVPFLQGVQLDTLHNRLSPLWKNVCHVDFANSLFFIGLQRQVAQGYLIDTQMRFITAVLGGKVSIPGRKDMLEAIAKDEDKLLSSGHKETKLLKLGLHFREYMEDLSDLADIPRAARIPEVVLDIFEDVIGHHDVCALREWEYVISKGTNGKEFYFKRKYLGESGSRDHIVG